MLIKLLNYTKSLAAHTHQSQYPQNSSQCSIISLVPKKVPCECDKVCDKVCGHFIIWLENRCVCFICAVGLARAYQSCYDILHFVGTRLR